MLGTTALNIIRPLQRIGEQRVKRQKLDYGWIWQSLWNFPLTELPFLIHLRTAWMLPRSRAPDVAQVACSGGSIWGQIWDVLGSETRLLTPSCLNHLSSLKVRQHWTLEKEGRKHLKTSSRTQLNSGSNNQIQSTCWWYYGDNETVLDSVKRTDFWTKRISSVRKPMS